MKQDRLRLLARIARMYHEQGLRQPEIAAELQLSQSRGLVRLLKEAVDVGIVRTLVVLPPGLNAELEDRLREAYGLRDAVVIDTSGATDPIPALGAGAAAYLEMALSRAEIIGVSSWSETLLAAIELIEPRPGSAKEVIQLLGGVGNPNVQVKATQLTSRLAEVTGARPIFVPAPGLVGGSHARLALEKDPLVASVTARWNDVTLALVGVGSLAPSPLLRESGNAVTEAEQDELLKQGAVGDVCLRYFNSEGTPVKSAVDKRVLGIAGPVLRAIPRRIAVAGGERKASAISAALRGKWVNILITDERCALRLLEGL